MATRQINRVVEQIRKVVRASDAAEVSDGQLLECFIARRAEAAFESLLYRHGPMVLSVCQRVLGNHHDAEDAFQATFLVLARKASSIVPRQMVGNWLYGVAYHTALKARSVSAKRQVREKQMNPMPEREAPAQDSWTDLQRVLDQELSHLSDTYRVPIVLCDLEGKSQKEVAQHLGVAEGTIASRLSRGRALLAKRLARQGLTFSAGALAAVLAQNGASACVSSVLASSTLQAAGAFAAGRSAAGLVSGSVASLTEGVLRAMVLTKLKTLTVGLVVACTLALLCGVVAAQQQPVANEKEDPQAPPSVGAKKADGKEGEARGRVDLQGDPLPKGAVARIGTSRLFGGYYSRFLAYAPDGKSLVSGSEGNVVRFWDPETGKEVRQLTTQDPFDFFALAPDGKTLVRANRGDSELRLLDSATGKVLRTLPGEKDGTPFIAFSPDGKTLAMAGENVLRMWDVATWQEKRPLGAKGTFSFAFLADGKTVISGARDGVRWWSLDTGREIRHLKKQLDDRSDFALSPDGKWLAAVGGGGDFRARGGFGKLHLWNAVTGVEIDANDLGKGQIWCLRFSPDSQTLLCSGPQYPDRPGRKGESLFGTQFFAADTGKELRRWGQGRPVGRMVFSPDGKTLAHMGSGVIQRLDALTGKPVLDVGRLPDYVMSVVFSPNGKSLVTSCWGGQIATWNPLTGKQLDAWRAPPKGFAGRAEMLLGTALTVEGTRAALVDAKGVLHVWEPLRGKALCRIDEPPVGEDAPVFSPDGKIVAVKHQDYSTRLWDSSSGKLLHALLLQKGTGHAFPHARAFSCDGTLLATAPQSDQDNTIKIWDCATGKERFQLGLKGPAHVSCVKFSPDGKCLIFSQSAGKIVAGQELVEPSLNVWDFAARRVIRQIPTKSEDIRSIAFSPDGKTLVGADCDSLGIWELATGKERGRLDAHRGWIWSVAFSPDGRLLASGSRDYTALIWDVTGLSPDAKLPVRTVQPEELTRLWSDLGDADAAKAYRAMWTMVAAQQQAVPFLAKRLRPVAAADGERIARLIGELDSKQFKVRAQASKELEQIGELAEPALTKALAGKPTLEPRRRLEGLLDTLHGRRLSVQEVHELRALEVLENAGTPQARQLLDTLAKGAPGARLTKEARAALDRLAKRAATVP